MNFKEIGVLEDHGFNSEIFLFGETHALLKDWLSLNLTTIGGIVANFNFSAPPFRGQIALVASGQLTEARAPDEAFFSAIKNKVEKKHVRAVTHALDDLTGRRGLLEASFIGGGYHLDCVRENYAIFEADGVSRFPPRPSTTCREPTFQDTRSKIRSRIQEAKFGVVIQGTDGVIVSFNKEGGLLVAHQESTIDLPNHVVIDENGLHARDAQEKSLFSVKSAELLTELGKRRLDAAHLIVFNQNGVETCLPVPIR